MFTDIVGYSTLINKDQSLALKLLEEHMIKKQKYSTFIEIFNFEYLLFDLQKLHFHILGF